MSRVRPSFTDEPTLEFFRVLALKRNSSLVKAIEDYTNFMVNPRGIPELARKWLRQQIMETYEAVGIEPPFRGLAGAAAA